ncbi:MAG: tetratricopeptide repeat protein [Pseudodesulfovibrio sp.]|nr:tetratricopeptide repeat protein [Pseudodesulfovibrio sp.]
MKRTLIVTLAILAGMVLAGCMGKTQNDQTFQELAFGEEGPVKLSSEQHEQLGDSFLRRNKPEMAFIHYNKAIEQDGDNLDARVKKGELLILQGVDEQALAEFNKVLEKNPDHAIANEAAGTVYFRASLYDEAETHLLRAVQLNPMLWKAHNCLGILYDRANSYDKAAGHLAKALELHHGNDADEIYNNLGVVHIARKQYGKAVDAFSRALRHGDVSARIYNNLGLALTRLGRLSEALEAFKYAGGASRAHNNLGYVLMTDGDPAKAVPYFEKAIELSPNYYVKAADNLKRARMASRFKTVDTQKSGSTPNPLLRKSFPDAEQNHGEPAASPASAGSPTSSHIQKISVESGPGDSITKKIYGLHVSSWRDHDWAFSHCAKLQKKGFETWINQVDLGEKGIWYRVLVGRFGSVREAKVARPKVLSGLDLDRAQIFECVRPVVEGLPL